MWIQQSDYFCFDALRKCHTLVLYGLIEFKKYTLKPSETKKPTWHSSHRNKSGTCRAAAAVIAASAETAAELSPPTGCLERGWSSYTSTVPDPACKRRGQRSLHCLHEMFRTDDKGSETRKGDVLDGAARNHLSWCPLAGEA